MSAGALLAASMLLAPQAVRSSSPPPQEGEGLAAPENRSSPPPQREGKGLAAPENLVMEVAQLLNVKITKSNRTCIIE